MKKTRNEDAPTAAKASQQQREKPKRQGESKQRLLV